MRMSDETKAWITLQEKRTLLERAVEKAQAAASSDPLKEDRLLLELGRAAREHLPFVLQMLEWQGRRARAAGALPALFWSLHSRLVGAAQGLQKGLRRFNPHDPRSQHLENLKPLRGQAVQAEGICRSVADDLKASLEGCLEPWKAEPEAAPPGAADRR